MSSRSGGSKKNVKGEKVIADNRKANYLFSIEEIFEAGFLWYSQLPGGDPRRGGESGILAICFSRHIHYHHCRH